MTFKILNGDCIDKLKDLENVSVDAIVTDPPSGISFMGKAWDDKTGYQPKTRKGKLSRGACALLGLETWERGFVMFLIDVFVTAEPKLKPGGHLLVWAIPRTSDLTALALRAAGFEIRDSLHHVYGSGFPKSHNVSKSIDKAAGAEREVVGLNPHARPIDGNGGGYSGPTSHDPFITAPATDDAKTWDGWGTALKPAHEVWWLARKPIEGTIAKNVLKNGTGALNIDGCRVEGAFESGWSKSGSKESENAAMSGKNYERAPKPDNVAGRWPSNLLLSHSEACAETCAPDCPVAEMDAQSGDRPGCRKIAGHPSTGVREGQRRPGGLFGLPKHTSDVGFGDTGGASRFFPCFNYTPKPSKSERNAGLDDFEAKQSLQGIDVRGRELDRDDGTKTLAGKFVSVPSKNHHPTVKPTKLMRWLVRLICPKGGTVLDPFMGSGTTGCAAVDEKINFIGIERDPEYARIAEARMKARL